MTFKAIKVKEISIQVNFSYIVNHDLNRKKKNLHRTDIMTNENFREIVPLVYCNTRHVPIQGFIQLKIVAKIRLFTKIDDLKTNPSQKSETLKRTLKSKIIM